MNLCAKQLLPNLFSYTSLLGSRDIYIYMQDGSNIKQLVGKYVSRIQQSRAANMSMA